MPAKRLREDIGSSEGDGLCLQDLYYGTERICNTVSSPHSFLQNKTNSLGLGWMVRNYRTEPIPRDRLICGFVFCRTEPLPLAGLDGTRLRNRTIRRIGRSADSLFTKQSLFTWLGWMVRNYRTERTRRTGKVCGFTLTEPNQFPWVSWMVRNYRTEQIPQDR